MLDLSYASDSDGERGYAAALVSTSLGSESSFRMPSPTRSPVARRNPQAAAPRSRAQVPKSPSPDSSLDELIDSFRASASSLNFASARDVMRTGSPVKKTRPSAEASRHAPSTKLKGILRSEGRPQTNTSDEEEVIGLSPMPKLTYVPKPKPMLSMPAPAPAKPHAVTDIKAPSKLQAPKSFLAAGGRPKTNRSKLISPKFARPDPVRRAATPPPPSPPTSDLSTTSSVMEDLEAPDADDAGDISVDDMISRDLRQLQRLVSSSHDQMALPNGGLKNRSLTSEDIERSFQRSTRFRDDGDVGHTSSSRLHSPHDRTAPKSQFRLESVQPQVYQHRQGTLRSLQLEDDSFVDELRTMKSNLLKEKEKKRNAEADAKKKREEDEKKKAAEGPGANIASLREAVDAIDKDLLLALRPFERMKQDQDKEDAKVAATEEKADAQLELPMATQALVEHLEQAFGGLTRQREAELKAEEDAIAEEKAAEEAKKKEEEEKKALEEANRKKEEEKLLSLLPLRGRLMNTESDVYDALLRLELAENSARSSIRVNPSSDYESLTSSVHDLARLRELATIRAREIEDRMLAPSLHELSAPRVVDWHRGTFDADDHAEEGTVEPDAFAIDSGESYSEIIKSEVVEKLDFTILKLRHALSIDQKEAVEVAVREREIEAERVAREKKKAEEQNKQEKIDSDAAAAKQRVMGVSSLQELPWVGETDTRLRQTSNEDPSLQRLQGSVTAGDQNTPQYLPSFFDERLAADRFESVRLMMESPQLFPVYKPQFSATKTDRQGSPSQPSGRLDQERSSPQQAGGYHNSIDMESVQHNQARRKRVNTISDSTPRSNQDDHRQPRLELGTTYETMRREVVQRKHAIKTPEYPRFREKERVVDMKRAIYELQANRREKAHWFHNSSRSR